MTTYQPSYNEVFAMWTVTTFVIVAIAGVCHRLTELDEEEYQRKQVEANERFSQRMRDHTFAPLPPPTPQIITPDTCDGCIYHHGVIYPGGLIICAVHPEGMPQDVEVCPDWAGDRTDS